MWPKDRGKARDSRLGKGKGKSGACGQIKYVSGVVQVLVLGGECFTSRNKRLQMCHLAAVEDLPFCSRILPPQSLARIDSRPGLSRKCPIYEIVFLAKRT